MATFGQDGTSTTYSTIENYIKGTKYALAEDGDATSITADINVTNGAHNAKFMIYASDNTLMGVTQQGSLAVEHSQRTLNFAAPVALTAGTYALCAWSQSTTGNSEMSSTGTSVNVGVMQSLAYNGAPDPLSPTAHNLKFNIYCTYTPSAGGVTVPVFTHHLNSMRNAHVTDQAPHPKWHSTKYGLLGGFKPRSF